ncbi:MAG: lipopolysaccharide heptosyltransferase family protein [Microcystis aeruginosa Ma_MB_F_20061100_S20]|nr:MAG: lipopolysaccharide heptosyltransferase family protein [Microcystis aeruginosa Ma_MB_F_20061100_S20]
MAKLCGVKVLMARLSGNSMQHYVSTSQALLHPLKTALKMGTSIQFQEVLHDPDSYLRRTPTYKIIKKFLHKFLYLYWHKQLPLLVETIPKESRTLLLYTGKDSFGDSNLELSGRSLLKHRDIHVDLLTTAKLVPQFEEDDIFENIYTSLADCVNNKYSHILIAEFNYKSIKLKCQGFKNFPFASLFGYFDGPARNQSTFSHASFNKIYELGHDPAYIKKIAKPYIATKQLTKDIVARLAPTPPFIAISVGGIDVTRTYQLWTTVLKELDEALSNSCKVILIGSENGIQVAENIYSQKFINLEINNFVGKLSLLQSREVISRANLFVGCDGGLMHIAHSTNTPSVTLFNYTEPNEYWLTPACKSMALQSETQVSAIPPRTVVSAVLNALASNQTSGIF